ncbi:MAG: class A beta-lactamase, subclass A2 [Bacteroidaceae bacterium]|nr:class A beta-lactamase, subclass A2 [Bacteroidaceae bacterium]
MCLKKVFLAIVLFIFPGIIHAELQNLEKQIRKVIKNKKAQVGVAVIIDGKDTVTVNNECQYPMMSVFKFHQALAVAEYCQRNKLSFDTKIYISKDDLKQDTYSPLRDKYPEGGFYLSLKELLRYTLQMSDNNACDILFKQLGGVSVVDEYIRRLGIRNFAIRATEDEMHKNTDECYRNWTTPIEAAKILELFLSDTLVDKEYGDFIKQTMIECETGKDRLVKPLLDNSQAIIGHKTGTGDRNKDNLLIGINDIGFVCLSDTKRYMIAVFVKDSGESMHDTSKIIADISDVVYQYVCRTDQ